MRDSSHGGFDVYPQNGQKFLFDETLVNAPVVKNLNRKLFIHRRRKPIKIFDTLMGLKETILSICQNWQLYPSQRLTAALLCTCVFGTTKSRRKKKGEATYIKRPRVSWNSRSMNPKHSGKAPRATTLSCAFCSNKITITPRARMTKTSTFSRFAIKCTKRSTGLNPPMQARFVIGAPCLTIITTTPICARLNIVRTSPT